MKARGRGHQQVSATEHWQQGLNTSTLQGPGDNQAGWTILDKYKSAKKGMEVRAGRVHTSILGQQ